MVYFVIKIYHSRAGVTGNLKSKENDKKKGVEIQGDEKSIDAWHRINIGS